MTWRQGSELIELAIPRVSEDPRRRAAPLGAGALLAALHEADADVSVLRGVLPRSLESPLVLELHGVAALYAQRLDGVWLLSYTHPLSAHQAFCAALVLQAVDRVADVCRQAAAQHLAARGEQHSPPRQRSPPHEVSPMWRQQQLDGHMVRA